MCWFIYHPVFPTGVENMGGGCSKFDGVRGGLESIHWGAWGGLKTVFLKSG